MTQGWGTGTPGDDRAGGDDFATGDLTPPVGDRQPQPPQYRHNPFADGASPLDEQAPPAWQQQAPPAWQPTPLPQQVPEGNGKKAALITLIAGLLVIALGGLLALQWDNLVGDDDSGNDAEPGVSTIVITPTEGSGSSAGDNAARPTSAALPGGVIAVNFAALNGEPTGDFNSVWKSGPTTDAFAIAVRDSYVDAYLDNRKTDQVISAYSSTTYLEYTMTCVDKGSYIHCTGGNDANVYIA